MRDHLRAGTEVLDGLRGLAIALVLGFHTWLFSWYTPQFALFGHDLGLDVLARTGYLGVELFFAISGFVLFFPHARVGLTAEASTRNLFEFVLRRAAKILPSYAIALVATMAMLAIVHVRYPVLQTLAVHVLFINNSYNDPLGSVNSVFWTLAVEVQFYVLFPLLAAMFRRAPLPTAGAMIATAIAYRFAVAGCCLLDERVYRQLPAYLDVFAAGMLAAYVVVWLRVRVRDLDRFALAFTLAALAFGYAGWLLLVWANGVQYIVGGEQRWDQINRTLLALSIGGFTVCSCVGLRCWRACVANPILVALSIISYNVYLWHTLVMIWMWKHGFLKSTTPDPHNDPHWKALFIPIC